MCCTKVSHIVQNERSPCVVVASREQGVLVSIPRETTYSEWRRRVAASQLQRFVMTLRDLNLWDEYRTQSVL